MSGSRIIESMKEALAIARGELPETDYRVHTNPPASRLVQNLDHLV
ncbi:MAG: hypothetical protein LBT23_08950 [Synergistaceae bacterium]|jgi:hypothetical protein|nr:hypothetical protein [Synergistaceae bacterium]